ncbi:MAG: alpha/beta fold hydrolase [bacterium]
MSRKSPARDYRSDLFDYDPNFTSMTIADQTIDLSYVETGPRDAETIVLLHGNPTWSFLYRNIIPSLEDEWHVIAPDFPGMGRSDKLEKRDQYSLANNLRALEVLLDELKLEDVTLAVHDWAGPIGLSWAVDHPERLSRLVIQNTWAFAPKEHNTVPQPLKTFRTPLVGDVLVQGLNVFVNLMLPLGVVHTSNLFWKPMAAYRAPFDSWSDLDPVLAFPREIPMSRNDRAYDRMKATDEGLRDLNQPVLFLWGDRDPVFPTRVIGKFRDRLENVYDERVFEDASHFLQEDRPDAIASAIKEFMKNT